MTRQQNTAQDQVHITSRAHSMNAQSENTQSSAPRQIHMSDLLRDMAQLKALLMRETALLCAMRIKDVEALNEEKLRLISRVELQKRLIESDPARLTGGELYSKESLKAMAKDIEKTARINYQETLKAREINRKVLAVVSGEMEKYERRTSGYNRGGYHTGYNPAATAPTAGYAVAINQTV